jgi:hypothetical protein
MTKTEQRRTETAPAGRRWLYEHSLFLVCFAIFILCFAGMAASGFQVYNEEQLEHSSAPIPFGDYLLSGQFLEATFENWESEFLQMGAYVLLTVWLRQRGSAESKPLDEETPQDEDPNDHRDDPHAPWPVRRGGVALALYRHSLSIGFMTLFALSWLAHAVGGAQEYSEEQLAHGGSAVTTWGFVQTSEFWFQSFQNWQSEFLAVASIVALSIFLREQGSPESKPVHAPHAETGS